MVLFARKYEMLINLKPNPGLGYATRYLLKVKKYSDNESIDFIEKCKYRIELQTERRYLSKLRTGERRFVINYFQQSL